MELDFDASLFSRTVIGDYAVYDDSLLFRAGTFPDRIVNGQPLTVTTDNLSSVVRNFNAPVGGNIQHSKFLQGRAAHVLSVRQSGPELRGTVAIPLWLDENLEPNEKRLSVELNPHTYDSLDGLALVTNPRISDAMLMSMFENFGRPKKDRHDTPSGQSAMQRIHDTAASSGALCKEPDSDDGKMSSKHERSALQTIHDHAVEHGASCNMDYGYYTKEPSMKLSEIFALFTGKGSVENDLGDKIMDPSGVIHQTEPASATPDPTKSAEFAAKVAEIERLQAELETTKVAKTTAETAQVTAEATRQAEFAQANETAVDALIEAGKFDPAEREQVLRDRAAAPEAFDRMAAKIAPAAEFSDDKTPPTVLMTPEVAEAQRTAAANQTSVAADRNFLSAAGLSPKL